MDKKAAAESKKLYKDIVSVIKNSDKVSDKVRQVITRRENDAMGRRNC